MIKTLRTLVFKGLCLICLVALTGGCARPIKSVSGNRPSPEYRESEKLLGIKVEALRLSAGGYMLDFRYRVLDPDKAKILQDAKIKPYLVDEATGAKFIVPTPPKVGALRQTMRSDLPPKEDRTYFMIFANPGNYVKEGNRVSIVVGDKTIRGLMVQ